MDKMLLTERETCEELKLGRSTLRRLMAEGDIKPVRIGRALRFPAKEIERFVADLQAKTNLEE